MYTGMAVFSWHLNSGSMDTVFQILSVQKFIINYKLFYGCFSVLCDGYICLLKYIFFFLFMHFLFMQAIADEPLAVASKVSKASSNSPSIHTKVSSITATNENEGVSVIRSDEVTGKSSTDGTTSSVAGKSGSFSRDALAKAKKALQIQKELSEKLKKIPAVIKICNIL